MNIKETKNSIRHEMGILLNLSVSPKWILDDHLVMGVKIGKFSAKVAAEQELREYTRACTEAFHNVQG